MGTSQFPQLEKDRVRIHLSTEQQNMFLQWNTIRKYVQGRDVEGEIVQIFKRNKEARLTNIWETRKIVYDKRGHGSIAKQHLNQSVVRISKEPKRKLWHKEVLQS